MFTAVGVKTSYSSTQQFTFRSNLVCKMGEPQLPNFLVFICLLLRFKISKSLFSDQVFMAVKVLPNTCYMFLINFLIIDK